MTNCDFLETCSSPKQLIEAHLCSRYIWSPSLSLIPPIFPLLSEHNLDPKQAIVLTEDLSIVSVAKPNAFSKLLLQLPQFDGYCVYTNLYCFQNRNFLCVEQYMRLFGEL